MHEKELVDVVLPVFNGQSTITHALKSVFGQQGDFLGLIIVINDGSTDGTLDVLEKLKHPKLRIYSTANQGVAAARNFGIMHCRSKWIAFLDADDIWSVDKIRIQLEAARLYQVRFVCSSVGHSIFSHNKLINQYSLFRGNFIATSSVLVERKLVTKVTPLFSTSMKFAEDYLAWFMLLCDESGVYITNPLVHYYVSVKPHYHPIEVICNLFALERLATRYLYSCPKSFLEKIFSWTSLSIGIMLSAASIIKRFLKMK